MTKSSAAAVGAEPKPSHQAMHGCYEPTLGKGCCPQMGALFAEVLTSKGVSAGNKVLPSAEG